MCVSYLELFSSHSSVLLTLRTQPWRCLASPNNMESSAWHLPGSRATDQTWAATQRESKFPRRSEPQESIVSGHEKKRQVRSENYGERCLKQTAFHCDPQTRPISVSTSTKKNNNCILWAFWLLKNSIVHGCIVVRVTWQRPDRYQPSPVKSNTGQPVGHLDAPGHFPAFLEGQQERTWAWMPEWKGHLFM